MKLRHLSRNLKGSYINYTDKIYLYYLMIHAYINDYCRTKHTHTHTHTHINTSLHKYAFTYIQTNIYIYIYIYIYVCVCVCVWVCVCVFALYARNEEAITHVSKNINTFYLQKSRNGCMRKKERDRDRDRRFGNPLIDIFRFSPGCDTYPEVLVSSCFSYRRLIQSRFSTQESLSPGLTHRRLDLSTLLTCLPVWLQYHYKFFWHSHIFILVPRLRKISHAIHVALSLSVVYLKTQLHVLFLKSTNWPVNA